MKIKLNQHQTLVLLTCNANRSSGVGFRWPVSGPFEYRKSGRPSPSSRGGIGGLMGALMGEGNSDCFNWEQDALWLVVRVNSADLEYFHDQVKVTKGFVVYCGDRETATNLIYAHGGKNVVGGRQTVGNNQCARVGNHGVAIAGLGGIAQAGDYGKATVGSRGVALVGRNGKAEVGYFGIAKAGDYAVAKAGDYGTAIAGDYGVVSAGYKGRAMAGEAGWVKVGGYGTAEVGKGGTVEAGLGSEIRIYYQTHDKTRLRLAVGYVNEKDLKSNVRYRVDQKGKFQPIL